MAGDQVDVVVIGSGFGGSVCAYRLAKAGQSVVLLERGKPYPPGSFARSPAQLRQNFWEPDAGRLGLFDFWSFSGFDAVVSSGLGGGSLIYANVLLRKDERWFVREDPVPGGGFESWPVTRADLDPHYDAVERMLTPVPYPVHHPDYAGTRKTHELRAAAAGLGLDWELPPLAVSFAARPGGEPGIGLPVAEPAYGNLHGRPRRTCRLCGECDFGCNDGAKNSLDHTYLSAAAHHGADIRTLCEAQTLRPVPGGYEVGYLCRGEDGSCVSRVVTGSRLVLAAGTYNTVYLLLRNRSRLPNLSAALGRGYCGNGDLLTFVLRARDGSAVRRLNPSHGPVITSMIRVPDTLDGGSGRGFVIQDAGYPGFVDWVIDGVNVPGALARLGAFAAGRLRSALTGPRSSSLSRQVSRLLSDGDLAAATMPLLGVGRDVPDGRMRLRDGWLDVDWTTATSRAYFERVRSTMRDISDALGGRHADMPHWLRKRIVTTHPLGGAPIGRDDHDGVCDPHGEVFGHPGLYVADGAAVPGPVGVNPAFTIAALADRLCDRMLERRRVPARAVPAAAGGPAGTATLPAPSTLSFTERMTGPFAFGEREPERGAAAGRRAGSTLTFELTVTIDDVDRFLDDPEHAARAEGWIECAGLGGRLAVPRGVFNMMIPGTDVSRRRMCYRLPCRDGTGELTLTGCKDLRDDPGIDLWRDTTTLGVRLLRDQREVAGAGVLRIRRQDFARQLATLRAGGPDPAATIGRVGAFFLGHLWNLYAPSILSGAAVP